jgi:two-component system phosphate regulon sensor histidine kinase PhoR
MLGFRQILDEMIYNLVDNAIKYNKERGSVLIQVNPQEDGILLSVRDTGIGIPDDARDRVFERFYRVDKSHSRQTGGTGLGLSIVKHGAMIHQASVRVDSTLGKGTDMQILFPPADPEDKAVPAAARD